MPNAIQSKRRSKLLAAGAMALTLTIGAGLLASGSAFAANADAASQVQSQTDSTSPSKAGGHFGHRGGGGFQIGAYESKLAAYLNVDEATLRTRLQTQTLAEIAEAQGVTRDALKAQLVAWIDEAKAAADSATTSTSNPNKPAQPDSSSMADKLLDSKGGKGVLGGGMSAKQQRGPDGFRGFGVNRDQLASALNLTADEFKEAAQSGKTLAAIAEAQGVTRDALKAQLVAWIDATRTASGNAADGSSATGTQKRALDSSTLADKLLDSPLVGAGKEAHAGFGGGMRALDTDAIAGVLGITADELNTSLASGQTLAGLATEKGVDVQQVIDALTASMKSKLDQRLSDGKLTQEQYDQLVAGFAEKASAIVNGQMGPHGKHGRPGAGSNSGDASNTAEDSSQ